MGVISKVPEKFSEHPGGVWAETEAARARIATAYFMVFWRWFKGSSEVNKKIGRLIR